MAVETATPSSFMDVIRVASVPPDEAPCFARFVAALAWLMLVLDRKVRLPAEDHAEMMKVVDLISHGVTDWVPVFRANVQHVDKCKKGNACWCGLIQRIVSKKTTSDYLVRFLLSAARDARGIGDFRVLDTSSSQPVHSLDLLLQGRMAVSSLSYIVDADVRSRKACVDFQSLCVVLALVDESYCTGIALGHVQDLDTDPVVQQLTRHTEKQARYLVEMAKEHGEECTCYNMYCRLLQEVRCHRSSCCKPLCSICDPCDRFAEGDTESAIKDAYFADIHSTEFLNVCPEELKIVGEEEFERALLLLLLHASHHANRSSRMMCPVPGCSMLNELLQTSGTRAGDPRRAVDLHWIACTIVAKHARCWGLVSPASQASHATDPEALYHSMSLRDVIKKGAVLDVACACSVCSSVDLLRRSPALDNMTALPSMSVLDLYGVFDATLYYNASRYVPPLRGHAMICNLSDEDTNGALRACKHGVFFCVNHLPYVTKVQGETPTTVGKGMHDYVKDFLSAWREDISDSYVKYLVHDTIDAQILLFLWMSMHYISYMQTTLTQTQGAPVMLPRLVHMVRLYKDHLCGCDTLQCRKPLCALLYVAQRHRKTCRTMTCAFCSVARKMNGMPVEEASDIINDLEVKIQEACGIAVDDIMQLICLHGDVLVKALTVFWLSSAAPRQLVDKGSKFQGLVTLQDMPRLFALHILSCSPSLAEAFEVTDELLSDAVARYFCHLGMSGQSTARYNVSMQWTSLVMSTLKSLLTTMPSSEPEVLRIQGLVKDRQDKMRAMVHHLQRRHEAQTKARLVKAWQRLSYKSPLEKALAKIRALETERDSLDEKLKACHKEVETLRRAQQSSERKVRQDKAAQEQLLKKHCRELFDVYQIVHSTYVGSASSRAAATSQLRAWCDKEGKRMAMAGSQ